MTESARRIGWIGAGSLLRRDDQIGCPVFTPIDLAEARLRGRRKHTVHVRAREG